LRPCAASLENIDVFRSICGYLQAFEFVLTVTTRAIAPISFNSSGLQITANWRFKKSGEKQSMDWFAQASNQALLAAKRII